MAMESPGNSSAAAPQDAASAAVLAHDRGRELYMLLRASSFTDEQKAAWAEIVPDLSLEQLDRLTVLLKQDLRQQIAEEFEDVFLKLKAAQTKHELSMSALALKTDQELAAIEKELGQES